MLDINLISLYLEFVSDEVHMSCLSVAYPTK